MSKYQARNRWFCLSLRQIFTVFCGFGGVMTGENEEETRCSGSMTVLLYDQWYTFNSVGFVDNNMAYFKIKKWSLL